MKEKKITRLRKENNEKTFRAFPISQKQREIRRNYLKTIRQDP